MAATAKLLKLRPKTLPTTTNSTPSPIHFFSSSTTTTPDSTTTSSTQPNPPSPPPPPPPSPPPPPPHSQSPFSFSFTDLKDNLKQYQPINPQQSQPPRKPFSFQRSPPPNLDEISRNLSEFRRRSAAPPPSPPSSSSAPQQISFQELYQRNVVSKGEESSDSYKKQHSFEAIRESLRHFKPSPSKNPSSQGGRGMDNSISLSRFRESLATRQMDPNVKSSPSDQRVFGVEIKKKEEGESGSDGKMRTEFVRKYSREDLGEKLRALRPEKMDKKDWFSLEELSQRLVKLRELEEKESNSKFLGIPFKDLRESIEKLSLAEAEGKKSPMQRIDILGHLGRTPDYMLYPPKEELVEKYFHPDNMSASEKLKLELMKVRDEFKMSESDCGSARVQVAQLTTKIKHLSTALHKKDKHSRKGLEAMVQRRKKLLKYLRRTDWDSYCFVLSKLGLRDNVDLAKRGYKN